jgi:hypothetical protein
MSRNAFLRGAVAAALCWAGLLAAAPGARAGQESFVYVSANPAGPNAIEALARNRQTGHLMRIGQFPTGGMGDPNVGGFEQHSVVTNGQHISIVNAWSDTVSAVAIRANKSLKDLCQAPTGGHRPVGIAPGKKFLYVANEGNPPGGSNSETPSYSDFRLASDGHPTPIPNSTVLLNPGDVVVNK